jgi:hypothetical protein
VLIEPDGQLEWLPLHVCALCAWLHQQVSILWQCPLTIISCHVFW